MTRTFLNSSGNVCIEINGMRTTVLDNDCTGVNLSNEYLPNVSVVECDFSNANFNNALLDGFQSEKCNFSSSSFNRTSLKYSVFNACNLNCVSVRAADIRFARFEGNKSEGFCFDDCVGLFSIFIDNDFYWSSCMDAIFSYAKLTRCKFMGALFQNVNFDHAEIRNCVFEKDNLNSVTRFIGLSTIGVISDNNHINGDAKEKVFISK